MAKIIKRLLIGAAVLVVLLTVAFFSIGLIYPKIQSRTQVEINKPADVVWAYFADESKMSEWLEGFKKIELISGNRNEVGSKYRMTFDSNGSEIVMTETVTEFNAPYVFAFKLENEVITDDVRMTFTEMGGKTTVVQEDNIVGGNIFWRSLFALTQSSLKGNVQKALDKLKTNVEQIN